MSQLSVRHHRREPRQPDADFRICCSHFGDDSIQALLQSPPAGRRMPPHPPQHRAPEAPRRSLTRHAFNKGNCGATSPFRAKAIFWCVDRCALAHLRHELHASRHPVTRMRQQRAIQRRVHRRLQCSTRIDDEFASASKARSSPRTAARISALAIAISSAAARASRSAPYRRS